MIPFHTRGHVEWHIEVLCCLRQIAKNMGKVAIAAIVLQSLVSHHLEANPGGRPNIVLILADDLGWSDTTLFGTTRLYETPNVERLARTGMTFRRAYSASPLCSPTRASILTGLSPARVGITSPTCHLKQVILEATVSKRGATSQKTLGCQSVTRLKTDYYTLSEALHDAGYATGHFGKWHLGAEPFDPLHHGFDVDIPHWPGPGPAGSYVAPWRFPDFRPRTQHEHLEDRMGDEAVAFIEQHKDEPFFLNYWQFSVHAPFDAKESLIEKYRGLVDAASPQRSPTYAAMVESLDDNLGKMLDTLDRLHLTEKTIIVFFSDNGGNMYNEIDGTTPTSNVPLRGGKATMYEGGVRVPCIVRWPGITRQGSRSDELIQSEDWFPTILDMLNLRRPAGQMFDGVSIVPALKEKPLDREAVFTFFPHETRVPDALPPAVAVHQGDWKLIRIFHDGPNQNHRYLLFNLKDDLGEKTDLAGKEPERVRQLDAKIDQFLKRTGAVLPQPNPEYDPGNVKLLAAGLSAVRGCRVAVRDGHIEVAATTGDPHFQCDLDKPVTDRPLKCEVIMTGRARGKAQLYWQTATARPAFHRDRSVVLESVPDGESHTYQVDLHPEGPLVALRFDPAQGPGSVTITSIRLMNNEGRELARWPRTASDD